MMGGSQKAGDRHGWPSAPAELDIGSARDAVLGGMPCLRWPCAPAPMSVAVHKVLAQRRTSRRSQRRRKATFYSVLAFECERRWVGPVSRSTSMLRMPNEREFNLAKCNFMPQLRSAVRFN